MNNFSIFTEKDIAGITSSILQQDKSTIKEGEFLDGFSCFEDTARKLKQYRKEFTERFCCNTQNELNNVWYHATGHQLDSPFLSKNEKISNIENFQEAHDDLNNFWEIHHRLETRGFGYSRKELIALGLYYDRPASELIFLRHKEHMSLHKEYNKLAKRLHSALAAYLN